MAKKIVALVVLGVLVGAFIAFASNDTWSQATTIQINQVREGAVNGYYDPVDWWKVYIPQEAAVVIFLEVSDGTSYRIDFKMYSSSLRLLGEDNRLAHFKPHFGTVAGGGYYYLKVKTEYSSSHTCSYKIGVAYTPIGDYDTLAFSGDANYYKANIVGGTITWLFVLDRSDNFDPDIAVYYNSNKVGGSDNSEDLDYVRWAISSSQQYEIKVFSYRGSGKYWVMMVTYHPPI